MRCYNGCPDSELKAEMDADDRARKALDKMGLHVVYFPMEGQYMVFNSSNLAVTKFYDTLQQAASAVKLEKL